jgi:hypothetical protein
VVGKSGVGKTSLIRTIPPQEPVFVISAENGMLSVRDLVQSGRIHGVEIDRFEDLKNACELLLTQLRGAYRWVLVDSLSEISYRCHEHYKKVYPAEKDVWSMWGAYDKDMQELIKGLRDMTESNVVFTCLETVDKEESGRRHVAPDLAGKKLKERVPAWFDEVFYMDNEINEKTREVYRYFITAPIGRIPGKDRSGRLALKEPAHLGYVYDKMIGLRQGAQ